MCPLKLFDIEKSSGKVSVYKITGFIDELLTMDFSYASYKGEPYKSIQLFFQYSSAPADQNFTTNDSVIHSDTGGVISKLTIDEIDKYSKIYIEKDKHLKNIIQHKKIQKKKNESQTEFLYRLFEYKTTVFNQEAFEILINCAKKGDFSEWNKFRDLFHERDIYLKGAKLSNLKLDWIDFGTVHLENSEIFNVSFKNANLVNVYLNNADIYSSDFSDANMSHSFLEGASFSLINFSGTSLLFSKNDSKTRFSACDVSKKTDLELANWEIAQYDQGLRQLVEKVNRKKEWELWYNVHSILKFPVKLFWSLTDYGTSIKGLIFTFVLSCLFFAMLYHSIPGLVDGLDQGYENYPDLRLFRAFYFSVVTMTTLGYGDIHAVKYVSDSSDIGIVAFGHFLLILQVILGYFILGALITFLGNLFKASGPIQPYSDELRPEKRHEYEIKKQSKYESKKDLKSWYEKKRSN